MNRGCSWGSIAADVSGFSELGANAVIGIQYDATEILEGVTEVLCYGTAVQVRKLQRCDSLLMIAEGVSVGKHAFVENPRNEHARPLPSEQNDGFPISLR